MTKAAWLVAAIALSVSIAAAQDTAPRRVPTVTRLVKVFAELENTLASALQNGDAGRVEGLLLEDFEMRVASMPGNPTPRAEWIRLSLGKPSPFRIEQMAVHDFGEVCVVSFLQKATDPKQRQSAKDIAVVDVWKRGGDSWRLAVRYAGPAGTRDFVIPGASTETPIVKRY